MKHEDASSLCCNPHFQHTAVTTCLHTHYLCFTHTHTFNPPAHHLCACVCVCIYIFIPIQERPDAILPTMGGQTGLNLAKNMAESGKREGGE